MAVLVMLGAFDGPIAGKNALSVEHPVLSFVVGNTVDAIPVYGMNKLANASVRLLGFSECSDLVVS